MGLLEQLSDRWYNYFNSSNTKNELAKMTKQDYLIFNKFNNEHDRNTYLINNTKSLATIAINYSTTVTQKLNSISLEANNANKKKLTNMEKIKNIISQLTKKMKNSFLAIIYTCLAIAILAILTLVLMNSKLDKFIRITSDFFYATKKAITDTFYKSLGALLSLNVTDFLEEFTNCIQDFLDEVRRLIRLTRQEGLDIPMKVLLCSIGIMALVLTFKYYQLYSDANGLTFDSERGA